MRRKFSVRDIAGQVGLWEATVDRVLHERPGVRAATVEQVRRAVTDLERQQSQVRLTGRTVVFDVVMAAPRRFADAVRSALEVELPGLHPATVGQVPLQRGRRRGLGRQRTGPGAADRVQRRGPAVARRCRGSDRGAATRRCDRCGRRWDRPRPD